MEQDQEVESLGIICGEDEAEAIENETGLSMVGIESLDELSTMEIDSSIQKLVFFQDVSEWGAIIDPRIYEFIDENGTEDLECYSIFLPYDEDCWEDILDNEDPSVLESVMEKAVLIEEPDDDDMEKKRIKKDYLEITTEKEAIDKLNEKNAIITIRGKTGVMTEVRDPQTKRPDIVFSTQPDFKFKYGNWLIDGTRAVDLWYESTIRQQFEGLTFAPNGNVPEKYYNLFKGFAVKPVEGDCDLYWDHVFENICDGNNETYDYVRKWMAHAIQYPATLPETALVLKGLQGTGKGVFVNCFGKLFGQHYTSVYRLDQITGRFNSHLKNILLLHANEAICQGDKVSEGVLKGIITDPTIPVEYKGKDIIDVPNYKRLIVATNEDWAVPMGMDDRRFLVMDVASDHKEDKKYFGAIYEQMSRGGLEALMYDLENENLDEFEVSTLPYSPEAFEQKMYNASSIVQWWHEMLKDGHSVEDDGEKSDGWKSDPVKEVLYSNFENWCKRNHMNSLKLAVFGKQLNKMLPEHNLTGARRKSEEGDGERRHCYALPELIKCRKSFETFSKSKSDIWED